MVMRLPRLGTLYSRPAQVTSSSCCRRTTTGSGPLTLESSPQRAWKEALIQQIICAGPPARSGSHPLSANHQHSACCAGAVRNPPPWLGRDRPMDLTDNDK